MDLDLGLWGERLHRQGLYLYTTDRLESTRPSTPTMMIHITLLMLWFHTCGVSCDVYYEA